MEPKFEKPTTTKDFEKLKGELELAQSMGLTEEAENIVKQMVELQARTAGVGLEGRQKCEQALKLLFRFIQEKGDSGFKSVTQSFRPQQLVEALTLQDFALFLKERFSSSFFGANKNLKDEQTIYGFPAGEYVGLGTTGVIIRFPNQNIAGMDFFEVWKINDPQIVARLQKKYKL